MWTFATARATSETNDRDEWDKLYSHSRPRDWLKVFRVYKNIAAQDPNDWIKSEWRLEGERILTPEPMVYIWGITRVTNTRLFTTMFSQALAARLAADLCIPLTENRNLNADMWSLYNGKLDDAAARDGMQGANEKLYPNRGGNSGRLIKTRFRGG
jgi:hypothetical protein